MMEQSQKEIDKQLGYPKEMQDLEIIESCQDHIAHLKRKLAGEN